MRFHSDNTATVCPELLEAIRNANVGLAAAYGDDEWTQRLDGAFCELFGTEVRAFVVSTGTAANALALATLSPPYGAIFAHEAAHIVHDECGAPEFFSGGARVTIVPGAHGKLTVDALRSALDATPPSVHTLQPAAVSLTQATELGTVYRPAELRGICDLVHERGMRVHMDGARFANAVAMLGCHPSELTWRAGIDVLSFGATKNGALADDFLYRRKRAGQLVSKSRYLGAQMLAYLDGDRWLAMARHANRMADWLAQAIGRLGGVRLPLPVQANEVFAIVPRTLDECWRARGARYLEWPGEGPGTDAVGEDERFIRLVTSFQTTEADVQALVGAADASPAA
jgi:threonine aldolase